MSEWPAVKRVEGHVASPTGRKVTIVGAGSVGVAIGVCLLAKNIADPLVLIDVDGDKALGEVQDMQHGSAFHDTQEIIGGNDYSTTEGSRVCIVTAGARQKPGQSRTDMLEANIKIMKHIITELVKYSPDAIFIIVSNPVDVLTYAAWKISGLPLNQIFGSGTHLDSSRFQYFIGKLTGFPVHLIKAQILGEHGASCAPIWSGVRVAGHAIEKFDDLFTEENKTFVFEQVLQSMSMSDNKQSDKFLRERKLLLKWRLFAEELKKESLDFILNRTELSDILGKNYNRRSIHHPIYHDFNEFCFRRNCIDQKCRNVTRYPNPLVQTLLTDILPQNPTRRLKHLWSSVPELLRLKGYTSTAVGFAVADQVESIIFNKPKSIPVSTLVKGFYGIEEEVFLSLPCLLGNGGISTVLPPDLDDHEKSLFKESADNMFKYQKEIDDFISE